MSVSTLQLLEENAEFASQQLTRIIELQGKKSPDYQNALKRFAMAWSTLKKTRNPKEFIN